MQPDNKTSLAGKFISFTISKFIFIVTDVLNYQQFSALLLFYRPFFDKLLAHRSSSITIKIFCQF